HPAAIGVLSQALGVGRRDAADAGIAAAAARLALADARAAGARLKGAAVIERDRPAVFAFELALLRAGAHRRVGAVLRHRVAHLAGIALRQTAVDRAAAAVGQNAAATRWTQRRRHRRARDAGVAAALGRALTAHAAVGAAAMIDRAS